MVIDPDDVFNELRRELADLRECVIYLGAPPNPAWDKDYDERHARALAALERLEQHRAA